MSAARRAVALLAALVVVTALLAGCGGSPDPEKTITVLAGSELKDLEPLLPDLEKATGIRLVPSYIGTLEGAEKIAGGEATDAAWFSHGKYLSLLPGAGNRIVASEKIMLSPVVIGVRKSVADRFGWTDNEDVTWKDIEAKAADGSFRFAMTNPAASNSGLTALIGVASALSGSSDALDAGQVDKAALRSFFKGQAMTAGSSGWLAEAYVKSQDTVDGIINYESVLLSLNAGRELTEPLVLVYPKEGIVTADYPLMLLNKDKRAAWDAVVAWLRTPEAQARIMKDTARRPAIPGVAPDARFPTRTLIELPYPAKLETIDALITAYLDEERKPASAVFVLDVSGSMDGERLDGLKAAMRALTGTDTSLTGRFARFRAREDVTIILFSEDVVEERQFTIDDTAPDGPDMTAIRAFVDGLATHTGTAIYTGLERAYEVVAEHQASDPDRLYSIVLMTDGENNHGDDLDGFRRVHGGLPDAVRGVAVFPVLFGEANTEDMQAIADMTGGRLFDATSQSLADIFKQIRGYQ
ncbi:MAG TPA: substrate-binding and VWA domain-containing protein [Candidatus Limnocylindrales bacterium]|nr:substrate-binding and VWA domain-containing protein [Candidatus Limnocylindrales bacterium]